jgi:hypothetical protein
VKSGQNNPENRRTLIYARGLFLGKLKNAWDLEFKKNPKLILVLCGSVSTWIEQNIIKNTGFFGRISLLSSSILRSHKTIV